MAIDGKTLAHRVSVLECRHEQLRKALLGDPREDERGDEDETPDRDPDDAATVFRPIRGLKIERRPDRPEVHTLEIVDYSGKPHHFAVSPDDLALLMPERSPASTTAFPGADPDEELTLARARLTNAEAEEKELRVAAMHRSLGAATNLTLAAKAFSVNGKPQRPGERAVWLQFEAEDGSRVKIGLPLKEASELVIQICDASESLVEGDHSKASSQVSSAAEVPPNDSLSTALARREHAQAALLELDFSERLAARGGAIIPGHLRVEADVERGDASICTAPLTGGAETRIVLTGDRVIWLAEQLLHAKRSLDGAED